MLKKCLTTGKKIVINLKIQQESQTILISDGVDITSQLDF